MATETRFGLPVLKIPHGMRMYRLAGVPAPFWASWEPQMPHDEALIIRALTYPGLEIAKALYRPLRLRWALALPKGIIPSGRHLLKRPQTARLVCDQGCVWDVPAEGVVRELDLLAKLEGPSPWLPGLPIMVCRAGPGDLAKPYTVKLTTFPSQANVYKEDYRAG